MNIKAFSLVLQMQFSRDKYHIFRENIGGLVFCFIFIFLQVSSELYSIIYPLLWVVLLVVSGGFRLAFLVQYFL